MVNFEIPLSTSTSILFFIVAVVAAYFAIERSVMLSFAYSSFSWFCYLGPSRWWRIDLDNLVGWEALKELGDPFLRIFRAVSAIAGVGFFFAGLVAVIS